MVRWFTLIQEMGGKAGVGEARGVSILGQRRHILTRAFDKALTYMRCAP